MGRVGRGAVLGLAWVALVSGCAREPSATAPSRTPTAPSTAGAVASVPADVEARLLRLKAELAVTPHFCSLESRPCRAQNRAVIDRGVDALLARCANRPRRTFDRCLTTELPTVVRELPSPVPDPATSTVPAPTASSVASALPPATER
jgi:hypothetical protein